MRANETHPWEIAWREGRWTETSPPLPAVVDFTEDLKREGAKKVLDLGCGAGRHSILLGKAGFQVVALVIALSTADFRRGTGRKLEPNTYVFTEGEERGIIHHFFPRKDLESCFRKFETVSFEERLIPVEGGGNRAHFLVRLRKA